MYNNIGLLTPRGSGTSGYVQHNKFNLSRSPNTAYDNKKAYDDKKPEPRKPNEEILNHNRKRELEVKLMELRDQLEENGYTEEEIEQEAQKFREHYALNQEQEKKQPDRQDQQETHLIAKRKLEQMNRLASAFGLEGAVEGEAFDREVQEAKKEQRRKDYEDRQKQKEKHLKEMEKKELEKQERREQERKDQQRKERKEQERQEYDRVRSKSKDENRKKRRRESEDDDSDSETEHRSKSRKSSGKRRRHDD